MRTATAGPVTPLLGSLGLHGGFVLALWIAVHPALHAPKLPEQHPDAWAGNTVEVDAVPTPDATASLPSSPAPTRTPAETSAAPEPAATGARLERSAEGAPEHAVTRPAPPRPRAASSAKPASARADRATPSPVAEPANGAGAAAPATGAFGAEGLAPGVRSLPSAFTRAIPAATGADPIWQSLPSGNERPFTIAVQVDEDGHISNAEVLEEKSGGAPPTQATHLRERVVALLGGGSFALQNNVSAGRALFRITITLSDTPIHDESAPAELVERGFEPPRGSAPGRAYFTLASGRHFEARVEVLNRP